MSGATIEQVNLLLKLYDARRETKLREARDWYSHGNSVFLMMTLASIYAAFSTALTGVVGAGPSCSAAQSARHGGVGRQPSLDWTPSHFKHIEPY